MRPYSYLMSTIGAETDHFVELPESKFVELLKCLLLQVEVDEDWYLANYRDVASAVGSGQLPDARAHYIVAGYFENRFPREIRVDERWYLERYPDVANALQSGVFTSAAQHFERDGFKEGRLPYPNFSLLGAKFREFEPA